MKVSASFNLIQYYLLFAFAITILIVFTNPDIVEEVLFFLTLNFGLLYLFRKNSFYKIPVFFFAATFFGGFIFRAYTMSNNILSYQYFFRYPLNELSIIETALQNSLFGFVVIMFGYCLITLVGGRKSIGIDKRFSKTFIKNINLILSVVLILTIIKLFLHVGLGLGLKGVKPTQNTGLAFIIRLLPRELPFIVLTIILLKYKNFISLSRTIFIYILAFLVVMSVLATGSKTFIMNFALAIAAYAIYYNMKVKLVTFIFISILTGALVSFSFVFSEIIRHQVFRYNAGFSDVLNLTLLALKELDLYELLGAISSRFSGLDGQVLLVQDSIQPLGVDWQSLYPVYEPLNILYQIIDNVIPIPGISLSSLPSSGQAIGLYVFKLVSDDIVFAGALGLFSSIEMTSKSNPIIYTGLLFTLGVSLGAYFKLIKRISNPELKFILHFFGCFLILQTTISGNFDLLMAQFIIKIILLFLYGYIVVILYDILKKKLIA